MARFAVTMVFETGPGKVPRGADVLDRATVPGRATHRFSYSDGRTLTVVIDWNADSEAAARDAAVLGVRLAWAGMTGADPGDPLSVRVRSLTPPVVARVAAGVRRAMPWHPEGLPSRPVLLEPRLWVGDDPEHGDDDGGLAGVREPRRPKPGPGQLSAALDEPGPKV